MKRVLLTLLSFCLLFTSGNTDVASERLALLFSFESELNSIADPIPSAVIELSPDVSAKYNASKAEDTYKYLKNDVSEESYQTLIDIYQYYGIELLFYDDSEFDNAILNKLSTEDYDEMISLIKTALYNLGSDSITISVVDEYIDIIMCFDTIIQDDIYGGYLCDMDQKTAVLALHSVFENSQFYTAAIFSCIATGIATTPDFDSYGFGDFYRFGFVGYNECVNNPEDEYLNFLASNNIIDNTDIIVELWNAGFFSKSSLKSEASDFTLYAFELIDMNTSLWGLYPFIEPIHSKTDIAINIFNDINPNWTKEFFLSLCQPDSLDRINNTDVLASGNYLLLLGTYAGAYQNNSGEMNAVLTIDNISNDSGYVEATFEFSPASGNAEGMSGKYRMSGNLDFTTGALNLSGTEWISNQPEGYNMFTIEGLMFVTCINAEIERDYLSELVLTNTNYD